MLPSVSTSNRVKTRLPPRAPGEFTGLETDHVCCLRKVNLIQSRRGCRGKLINKVELSLALYSDRPSIFVDRDVADAIDCQIADSIISRGVGHGICL